MSEKEEQQEPTTDDDERLRTIVKEELAKLNPPKAEKKAETVEPQRIMPAKSLEAQAEEMVRQAAAKLKREEDDEALRTDVADLKKQVKKASEKAAETPPKKVRRLTRILWGSDD